MFNENSIMKEVNIINKVMCYFLILMCLLICSDVIFLLFVDLFLLLLTKQDDRLFRINIINTVILIFCLFFPHFLWITKILTLVLYTVLVKKVTKAIELRYVLESTLYRFQSKRITYRILYIIYFIKYYKNNIRKLFVLKDDYGINLNFKFFKFMIQKAYLKTKLELKNLMIVNNLRFYNYSKDRTYVEKPSWESWDNNFLVCHLIILLLTIFYGR